MLLSTCSSDVCGESVMQKGMCILGCTKPCSSYHFILLSSHMFVAPCTLLSHCTNPFKMPQTTISTTVINNDASEEAEKVEEYLLMQIQEHAFN